MKYLMNEGKDTHYYNLWSDRARKLRTNKRVVEAVQQIDPEAGLPSRDDITEAEMVESAHKAGLKDVRVTRQAGTTGITVDADYDSDQEQTGMLRKLGMIL